MNYVVLFWASGFESWWVMLSQWLWIMVCYSEPVVVNHGVLCWACGCESWWAIIEFNIRLYDKNSESDYFFSSTKIRIFFSATLGITIFLLEKKHIPPFKLNGRSLTHSLEGGRWFYPGTLGTNNKTDRRVINEILLKVALNAMTIILSFLPCLLFFYETNWDMNYNLLSPLEWWSRQIS